MRNVLILPASGWLAALLLVLVLLGAGPVWAQAKPTGALTVALSSFSTDVIDPALGGHTVKFYLSLIFDHLIGATADGQLARDGGIARSWEASADGKRWTFLLRKGVRFHNGEELTSEDVKFSLLRAMGKRSTTGFAGPLRALIQEIETPTPDRVVIVTKQPTLIIPTYLSRVLSTEGMVLPKKYVEAKGDDAFARAAIGSGPYRVLEVVSGSHVKLEAVDNHWRIGVPRYKHVTFKRIPEEATRIAMLRRGEVDIIELSRDRVKEVERAGFPVHLRREDGMLEFWWIPPLDKSPLRDKRVREALNLAIDRAEIAQTIFGGMAEPAAVPFGFSLSLRDVGFKVTQDVMYRHDPARAKKLLADAGYPNGFEIQLFAYQLPGLPEGRSMAEALGGYWQKIGVQTKLVPVDYPAFRKQWLDRSAPGSLGYYNRANQSWIGNYAVIEKYTAPEERIATIRDADIDGMVEAVMRQTDQEKVNALMRKIYLRLRGEHLGLALVHLHTPYGSSKRVANWNPGSVPWDLNIEELVTSK